MTRRLNPPQVVALSFFCVIVIGTMLLSLPMAVEEGNSLSLMDSIFTATSATCVTGLIVKNTGSFFSPFGKAIIFILIQVGGLGIMTFSTFFAIILGRKLTIKDNVVIQRALNQQKVEGIKDLLKYVLLITFGLELAGALLLFLRWMHTENWSLAQTACNAIFHSVSAFCNAGFSFFPTNFTGYISDPFINIVMISLIFLGGIGFVVLLDIPKLLSFGNPMKKVSVQAKLAVTISVALIIIGTIFIFTVEQNNVLSGLTLKEKVLASLFQSVTPRTAGFNTVDIGSLLPQTVILFLFLMFIGASPGSTGGGVKTCTFGVLLATFNAMIHNREKVAVFKRTIPKEVIRRAVVVIFLAVVWIFFGALVLSFTEAEYLKNINSGFMKMLFEVTSAFGTVGLSTGITPYLSMWGKILIITTMFVGRVGPLTVALTVALQKDKIIYTYPEERIMVG